MNSKQTSAGHGLVGAMDLTGNPNDGQNTHLAIIIGLEDYLHSVVDSLGYEKVHMRSMDWKAEKAVMQRLNLSNKNCVAVCVRIDRNSTVDAVLGMRRVGNTYAARRKVLQTFHRRLLDQLEGLLKNFLTKHNVMLSDIPIQCDSDCVGFAKDVGLLYEVVREGTRNGRLHGVADAIAWGNNRGMEPRNVIWKNAANTLRKILMDDFTRHRR